MDIQFSRDYFGVHKMVLDLLIRRARKGKYKYTSLNRIQKRLKIPYPLAHEAIVNLNRMGLVFTILRPDEELARKAQEEGQSLPMQPMKLLVKPLVGVTSKGKKQRKGKKSQSILDKDIEQFRQSLESTQWGLDAEGNPIEINVPNTQDENEGTTSPPAEATDDDIEIMELPEEDPGDLDDDDDDDGAVQAG